MLSHGQRSSAESATPWAEKNVPEHTHPAPLPPTSHSHKNRDSHIHSSNVNDSLNNNNNNKNNNDDDDVSTDNNSSSVAGVAGSAVEQPKQHGSRIPPWPLRNDSCMREPRDGSSLRMPILPHEASTPHELAHSDHASSLRMPILPDEASPPHEPPHADHASSLRVLAARTETRTGQEDAEGALMGATARTTASTSDALRRSEDRCSATRRSPDLEHESPPDSTHHWAILPPVPSDTHASNVQLPVSSDNPHTHLALARQTDLLQPPSDCAPAAWRPSQPPPAEDDLPQLPSHVQEPLQPKQLPSYPDPMWKYVGVEEDGQQAMGRQPTAPGVSSMFPRSSMQRGLNSELPWPSITRNPSKAVRRGSAEMNPSLTAGAAGFRGSSSIATAPNQVCVRVHVFSCVCLCLSVCVCVCACVCVCVYVCMFTCISGIFTCLVWVSL